MLVVFLSIENKLYKNYNSNENEIRKIIMDEQRNINLTDFTIIGNIYDIKFTSDNKTTYISGGFFCTYL